MNRHSGTSAHPWRRRWWSIFALLYLSTLRKQGVALLAALHTLFTGIPLYPALV